MAILVETTRHKIVVLVVEDDESHAELIRRSFAAEPNVEILLARTVGDARQLIRDQRPDMVLADLLLSDGRGTDLLRCIENDEPPPLVLLTSHRDERVAVEAMKAGALDYVVKSPETLQAAPSIVARALREWNYVIDRRRAESELRDTVHALRELHRITLSTSNFEEKLRDVLKLGCETLGVTTGVLLRLEDDSLDIRAMHCSASLPRWLVDEPIDRGWCVLDPRRTEPLCLDDLETSDFRRHPLFLKHRIRAYAGIGVGLGVSVRGYAVFFADYCHETPFNTTSAEVLKLMSRWIESEFLRQEAATALRDAEDRFQQAQRLEAVARLASGVAHDYNNLLMGIAGCIDIAQGAIPQGNNAHAYLEEAKGAAHRGSTLTRQLLDFIRRRPSERAEVSPSAIVERNRRLVESLVGEQITVTFSLDAKHWSVWIDEGHVEQILMNLVVNARDAMPTGGHLTIETREVKVDNVETADPLVRPGDYVTLTVRDTGCGMTDEVIAKAFKPFFTTKTEGRGTGLGLATVRSIVDEGGGQIKVESQVGQGTAFVVYLPSSQRMLEQPATCAVPSMSGGGGQVVLLVEDEVLVRMTLRSYLERRGYRVIDARDVVEAARVSEEYEGTIDLILTDMMLPSGSGKDVVRQVMRKRPGVRALYMSAHPEEVLVQSGRLEPETPVLHKPFGEETLFEHMRKVLGPGIPERKRGVKGEAIVVVEDNDLARMALRELLADLGRPVLVASRPSEALAQIREQAAPIALLLTDFALPEMTGAQLAEEVRKSHPDVRVVFMSGRHRVPQQPGDLFVLKPVEFPTLLKIVEGALM